MREWWWEPIDMSVKLQTSFATTAFDSEQPEHLGLLFGGISKIICFQFSEHLTDKWQSAPLRIKINFVSQDRVNSINAKNENTAIKRNKIVLKLDEVLTQDLGADGTSIVLSVVLPLDEFKDLGGAIDCVEPGKDFAIPVNNVRNIPEDLLIETRQKLILAIYEALQRISQNLGLDMRVLELACEAVRADKWYVERDIGAPVTGRGKDAVTAQLIGRWEPDYVYHYARLFDESDHHRDVLFMIYWRSVGLHLLDNPGRLSWSGQNELKYIPTSRDEFRLAFKTNKGDVDFGYYFDPPQRRSSIFYAHFADAQMKAFEKNNTIKLNFSD